MRNSFFRCRDVRCIQINFTLMRFFLGHLNVADQRVWSWNWKHSSVFFFENEIKKLKELKNPKKERADCKKNDN